MHRDSKWTCSRIFTPVAKAQAILEQISKIWVFFFSKPLFFTSPLSQPSFFKTVEVAMILCHAFSWKAPGGHIAKGREILVGLTRCEHTTQSLLIGVNFLVLYWKSSSPVWVSKLRSSEKTHIDLLHNLFSPVKNGRIRGKVTAGVGNHTTVTGPPPDPGPPRSAAQSYEKSPLRQCCDCSGRRDPCWHDDWCLCHWRSHPPIFEYCLKKNKADKKERILNMGRKTKKKGKTPN